MFSVAQSAEKLELTGQTRHAMITVALVNSSG